MSILHTQLNTWHHKYICIPQNKNLQRERTSILFMNGNNLEPRGLSYRQTDTRDEMLSRKNISCTGWKKQQIHEHSDSIPSHINYDHSCSKEYHYELRQWRKSFFLQFLFSTTDTLIPKISKFYIIWISIHLHVYISLWRNSATLLIIFYHFLNLWVLQ